MTQTADVTPDAIRTLVKLKLEPNATCGFVRETYRSALSIAPGVLHLVGDHLIALVEEQDAELLLVLESQGRGTHELDLDDR